MLESVFIVLLIVGFLIFMWAIEKKSYVLSLLSAIFWMIVYAQSWQIEVPCDTSYTEPGISALAIGFVLISIVFAIYFMVSSYVTKRYEEMKKDLEERYRSLP